MTITIEEARRIVDVSQAIDKARDALGKLDRLYNEGGPMRFELKSHADIGLLHDVQDATGLGWRGHIDGKPDPVDVMFHDALRARLAAKVAEMEEELALLTA